MHSVATLPEYLPARMLNEFVYCPRLFFYEWVEGVFAHNLDTVEGAQRHARVDTDGDSVPSAAQLAESPEQIHSRSVTLSSDELGLIAKLDLLEGAGGQVSPVDYKRGSPRKHAETGQPEPWEPERVQLAAQALVLLSAGYRCEQGVLYYATTKQRVPVVFDDALLQTARHNLAAARELAESGVIPPPLEDSPKCPRCSLVGICLPDETRSLPAPSGRLKQRLMFDLPDEADAQPAAEAPEPENVRRLVPARDDLRPLYLNTQGLYVGKSGAVLKVKEKDKVVQEVRLGEISQLCLFGNVQLTTQTIQSLCEAEIPIAYFSMGGWFYGVTHGLGIRNIYLRREQFRLAESAGFCLRLARALVAGKIRNQRTMLQRNHVQPPARAIAMLRCLMDEAEQAPSLETLLGIEGNAARYYFEHFSGMLKHDDPDRPEATPPDAAFRFDFVQRNRRPPRDPINALLSLAYSVLAKDLTITCHAVGFDPFQGYYHQPRFGRAALALDLMEPFRPLIADSAVLSAVNTRMVTPNHFVRVGPSVALTPEGRKAFFRAYEQRMDTLVTHPSFGYRVSYRRVLEIQTRLLARVVTGEHALYPVFVTR